MALPPALLPGVPIVQSPLFAASLDAVEIVTGELVPNRFLGEAIGVPPPSKPRKKLQWLGKRRAKQGPDTLPEGFDPDRYLALNPDVADDGADPVTHWQRHGRSEGRRYL